MYERIILQAEDYRLVANNRETAEPGDVSHFMEVLTEDGQWIRKQWSSKFEEQVVSDIIGNMYRFMRHSYLIDRAYKKDVFR